MPHFNFTKQRQDAAAQAAHDREQAEGTYRTLIVKAAAGKLTKADEVKLETAVDILDRHEQAEADVVAITGGLQAIATAAELDQRSAEADVAFEQYEQAKANADAERDKAIEAANAKHAAAVDQAEGEWLPVAKRRGEAMDAKATAATFRRDYAEWPLPDTAAPVDEPLYADTLPATNARNGRDRPGTARLVERPDPRGRMPNFWVQAGSAIHH